MSKAGNGRFEPGIWFGKCEEWLAERENPLSAGRIGSCWQEGNSVSAGQVRPLAAPRLQGSQGGCAPLDLEQHTLRGLLPRALEQSATVFFVDRHYLQSGTRISLVGFLGLRGHRQLVLKRDNTQVTRVWEWSTGLKKGLGRAAHGVGKMFAEGAGVTDSLFSRCASLTWPGGTWDGTAEDGTRNGRDYWWQGWKGKGWELTTDVPWVKLQVLVKAEGIAAAALSWSTMPGTAALLAKKVADAERAKQQAADKKQQEQKDNPAAWAREKTQQWADQEAAQKARAEKTTREYEETGRAQDELNQLERDMRGLDITLEEVGAEVVTSILKILTTGGYRLEGKRLDQEANVRLQLLASMIAMRKEERLQAWNAGSDIKQIMDQRDGKVVLIVQMREVTQCSKSDIVTALRPMLPDIQVGDITGLGQEGPKNQAAGGKKLRTMTPTFEIKISPAAPRTFRLTTALQDGQIVLPMEADREARATLKVRSTLAQEVEIDEQERRKIKTMYDILEAAGFTLEDLNKLMSAGFRSSLSKENLDDGFMGVRMVEQVYRNRTPVRLGPDEIVRPTDHGGPAFKMYWSSVAAKHQAERQRIDLSCWLGSKATTSLLQVCAHTRVQAATGGIGDGVQAATARALAEAERILENTLTLLLDAEEILDRALDQDETGKRASITLKALHDKEDISHDATAEFVQRVIWEICNHLHQHEHADIRVALRQHLKTVSQCKAEVARRRDLLGPPVLVRVSKLENADLGRNHSRIVRAGGVDIRVLTSLLTLWFRECLKDKEGDFLCLQPIMKKTLPHEPVAWDWDKGVVMVLQATTQLNGKVFGKGDWKCAKVLEEQQASSRVTITIPTFDQKTKKKSSAVVTGAWLKDDSVSTVFAQPALAQDILKTMEELEGWWVPKEWGTEEGEEKQTTLRGRGDQKTTRVTALPAPSPEQSFHIGNLHQKIGFTPSECDKALEAIQLLVDEEKIKAIEVHGKWFLFLLAPYAEDTLRTIQAVGDAGLTPGASVRDWVVGSSTLVFLRQLRLAVGQGIWLDYRVVGANKILSATEEEQALQEHGRQEGRWYHAVAPLRETGFVSTKNVTLMAAAFTSKYAAEESKKYPSMVVYNVGAQNAVVLFENSIYTSVIDTRPLLVGGALAEIFKVPQDALDAFYDSLCAGAQNYMGKWKVLPDRLDALPQDNILEHHPTRDILAEQRKQGQSVLYLTRQQVRDLIAATAEKISSKAGLSIIALENGECLIPDPQGPGMLWVLGQSAAGGDRQPITGCKIQWSSPLSAKMQESKRDHGRMLIDVLQVECPELVHGTMAMEMVARLADAGRLMVVAVAEGYLVVTPEVIAPASEPGARSLIATLPQQFGEGVHEGDFLNGCENAWPSLTTDSGPIEASVRILSTKTLNGEIQSLLREPFVWKGVSVTAPEEGANAYQNGATLTQQLLKLQWRPVNATEVERDIDMQQVIKHPGGRDMRGPTRLLSMVAAMPQHRPRFVPIGQDRTSILVVPQTTRYSFLAWDYDDSRFRHWKPVGKNSLKRLEKCQSKDPSAPDRSKASGKTRSREEDDGSGDMQRTPPMANLENSANGEGSALVIEDE